MVEIQQLTKDTWAVWVKQGKEILDGDGGPLTQPEALKIAKEFKFEYGGTIDWKFLEDQK